MKKQYSREIKEIIKELYENGKKPKIIAELLNIDLNKIYCIIHRMKKNYNKENIENRGRKKKLNKREERMLVNDLRKNKNQSIRDMTKEYNSYNNMNISKSTVYNVIKDNNFNSYVARKKPFLSEVNIKKRLNFSKEFFCKSIEYWRNVIWSDECSFKLFNPNQNTKYWKQPEKSFKIPTTVPTKTYSEKIMVWSCFSYNGVGKLIFIEENINSLKYQQILVENLNESANMMGLNEFIFQQDNAPPHSSKLIQNFFNENNINVLPWPAQSPDLNPIENLWAIISLRLTRKNLKSKKELKEEIRKIWSSIELSELRRLVDSIPNRLREVVEKKGFHTKY
jgi:transposase